VTGFLVGAYHGKADRVAPVCRERSAAKGLSEGAALGRGERLARRGRKP